MDLARRLSAEGLLSDDELAALVARRAVYGEPVPVALLALKIANAQAVEDIFDRMGFAPVLKLRASAVTSTLPKGLLRGLWAVPVGENEIGFVVAMADPTDAHALAELAYHLKKPIDPRTARIDALRVVLNEVDPLPAPPRVETRPAAAAPPPEHDYTAVHIKTPTPAALSDDVMAIARRPSHRRHTPAYGQAVNPEIPALGRARSGAVVPKVSSRARVLNMPSGTIGGLPAGPPTPAMPMETRPHGDSEVPIPLAAKRVRRSVQAPPLPKDSLYILTELRQAEDRDAVAVLAARGMLTAARRAAFFVVKRGVVQGWEGATTESTGAAGFAREALRNLWIPVTSHGVFRRTSQDSQLFIGSLADTTADSILAAALGGHPDPVLLYPLSVRGHCVAFVYADGLLDAKIARTRADEIAGAATESLERLLAHTRTR